MTIGRAWRGLTRGDRLVLGLALLLVLSSVALPRALFLVHPEADNLARFRALLDAEGGFLGSGAPLWVDGQGQAISPIEAVVLPRVAEARSDLPRDRWGERWRLVVVYVRDQGPQAKVFSPGPDRRFEGGAGDDLRVWPGGGGVGFQTTWWPLLWLAGLLAFAYLSGRMAMLPRARSTWVELGRATAMAIAPAAVVSLLFREALEEAATDRLTWVLVSPGTAALTSASLAVWGACVANRLVRPMPPEPVDGPC